MNLDRNYLPTSQQHTCTLVWRYFILIVDLSESASIMTGPYTDNKYIVGFDKKIAFETFRIAFAVLNVSLHVGWFIQKRDF